MASMRSATLVKVPRRMAWRVMIPFIDGYNQRCQPFAWTKTADQILAKAVPDRRQATQP
jgi:hypothetical protein